MTANHLIEAARKLALAAARLTDCVAEFGEQKVPGDECLCTSCAQLLDELDSARIEFEAILAP